MVLPPDFRKSIRFGHKSIVTLTDEHSEHLSYAQMLNFSGDGLYFKSDVSLKPGTKIKIQFDYSPFHSSPKELSSIVRWCRELAGYDSDYIYGVGVK